ncbi:MAG: Rid family detoxifying hydrolase [Saprospiraceae bacterium]|nr:Rid family detoxifying hydrolase [Saprospiraceae bacterium]
MKNIVNSALAPSPVGPYNQAVMAGDLLFISGQIAIDPKTNDLMMEDIEMETRQVLDNIVTILREAHLTTEDVVKCTIFVADMHLYDRINAVYSEYFRSETAPARELVEVANLPKFVNLEISAIAMKSS